MFFAIDPGADASLGDGNALLRTNAVRYGTMKDNVLAMKVVLANGEVMSTGRGRRSRRRLRPDASDVGRDAVA